jgi:hypothetical protein
MSLSRKAQAQYLQGILDQQHPAQPCGEDIVIERLSHSISCRTYENPRSVIITTLSALRLTHQDVWGKNKIAYGMQSLFRALRRKQLVPWYIGPRFGKDELTKEYWQHQDYFGYPEGTWPAGSHIGKSGQPGSSKLPYSPKLSRYALASLPLCGNLCGFAGNQKW